MTNAFIREDTKIVLDILAASDQPAMDEVEPAIAREMYLAMRPLLDAEPTPLARIEDFKVPGPAGDVPVRLYDPRATRDPGPAIIFYHGGGFVIGNLETHHPFCTEMAAQMDLPVIAVDYRLAPEHPFPAAPDDCEAVTRWLAENGGAMGLKITGLIPCGDSAGGNLAIVVTQALMANPANVPVIAQVPFYPAVQMDAEGGSMEEFAEGFLLTKAGMDYFDLHYAPDDNSVRVSCILGDHRNMPPSIVVTAGLDPLRDQGRGYAAALAEAGSSVVYLEMPGTIHGFICLRKALPSSQQDCEKVFRHLKAVLAGLY